jgi:hypothetical protein
MRGGGVVMAGGEVVALRSLLNHDFVVDNGLAGFEIFVRSTGTFISSTEISSSSSDI